MAVEEHIKKLNELLSVEVPRFAPLAWIRSDDKRLWMPMQETDERGRPIMDTLPLPGTKIVLVQPKVEFVPLFPDHQGDPVWVLCRMEGTTEDDWNKSFGTVADRPAGGVQWLPVWTNSQLPPLHIYTVPTRSQTWDIIEILKSAEEYKPGKFRYQALEKEKKIREANIEQQVLRMRDRLAAIGNGNVVAQHGKNSGGASFPSTGRVR